MKTTILRNFGVASALAATLAVGLAVVSPVRAAPLADYVVFNGVPNLLSEGNESLLTFAGPFPNAIPGEGVLLLEPGTNTISDAIYIDQNLFLNFVSDTDTGGGIGIPFNGPIVGIYTETGLLQDVGTNFLNTASLPLFTPGVLQVASDVDVVPEPSTIGLVVVGLLGV